MKEEINHLQIETYAFDQIEVGTWWNFKKHISPFARIFLIHEGEQKVTFHGKTYHQKKGTLALIPPYTPVDYVCDDRCSQYYLIFSCRLDDGKDLFTDYRFPYELTAEAWCYELCQRLHQKLPNLGLSNVDADSKDFNQMIFSSQLEVVNLEEKLELQGLVSLLLSPFAAQAEKSERFIRFSKSLQFIEKNLSQDLSLSLLSEMEGMSKTYYSDQFSYELGIRPSDYIAHKREIKARALLENTVLSVAEIGVRVGIADQAYFCRFFKKRVGVSPKKYRLL